MAKLIPKIHPNEIDNPGERKIATALIEQLPTKVEVFHSFQWLDLQNRRNEKSQNQRLQQGECDFVVLHPDLGLLFIEVKGGCSPMMRKTSNGSALLGAKIES